METKKGNERTCYFYARAKVTAFKEDTRKPGSTLPQTIAQVLGNAEKEATEIAKQKAQTYADLDMNEFKKLSDLSKDTYEKKIPKHCANTVYEPTTKRKI